MTSDSKSHGFGTLPRMCLGKERNGDGAGMVVAGMGGRADL